MAQKNDAEKAGTKTLPDTCWHIGKRVDKCEMVEELPKFMVFLDLPVHLRTQALTERMGNKEWLAYLHGEKGKGYYFIRSLEVPEQEVTATSVEVLKPKDALGTIHSHHNMGVFHSGTDDKFVGGNHALTIVCDNDNKYKAKIKMVLPCKASVLIDADVVIETPEDKAVDEFVENAIKNIKEKHYEVVYTQPFVYSATPFCGSCHKQIEVGVARKWVYGVVYHDNCKPLDNVWERGYGGV